MAAVVVIVYTMTGGIIAVAYTDVAQLGLMIIAIFVLLPTVMMSAGGIESVFSAVPPENTSISAVGNDILFAWLLAVMPGQLVKQTYHQRIFSAKDERTAKQGLYNLAIASILAGIWAALMGMSIYALNPTLVDQEHAAVWVIQNTLHPIVAALALAAIVAAVVSSADSSLHSASASLTRDFYKQIIRPAASDKEIVRISKLCVMVVGIAGIFIGISIPSVLEALLIGYSLSAAGLLFPLVIGRFWSRANRSGAITGIVLGVATTIFFKYSGGLPSYLPPVGAGLAASFFGTVAVSLVSGRRPR